MKWLICDRCGAEVSLRGPDALDWCDECGVVEGNTHYEEEEKEEQEEEKDEQSV